MFDCLDPGGFPIERERFRSINSVNGQVRRTRLGMFRNEVSPYFFFQQFFELYKYFLPSQIFATRIRATDLPKAEKKQNLKFRELESFKVASKFNKPWSSSWRQACGRQFRRVVRGGRQ